MALITRQGKGSKLTIQEMDGNLIYLEQLSLSIPALTGSNYVFVPANGTPEENGQDLLAAYNDAKEFLNPSEQNPIIILAAPGFYSFDNVFEMKTEGLYLFSLDGNRSIVFNGTGTILVDSNHVQVKGVDTLDKPFRVTGGLSQIGIENCKGGHFSFGYRENASGTYLNCEGGVFSFGGRSVADGTYTQCIGGWGSFGGQKLINPEVTDSLTGKLYRCRLLNGFYPPLDPSSEDYGMIRGCDDGFNNFITQLGRPIISYQDAMAQFITQINLLLLQLYSLITQVQTQLEADLDSYISDSSPLTLSTIQQLSLLGYTPSPTLPPGMSRAQVVDACGLSDVWDAIIIADEIQSSTIADQFIEIASGVIIADGLSDPIVQQLLQQLTQDLTALLNDGFPLIVQSLSTIEQVFYGANIQISQCSGTIPNEINIDIVSKDLIGMSDRSVEIMKLITANTPPPSPYEAYLTPFINFLFGDPNCLL